MYQPKTDDLRLPEHGDLGGIRHQLRTAGHTVLPTFAHPALLDALRHEADRLSSELYGQPEGTVISRDIDGHVLSMHYLDRHSDLLFDLTRLPELQHLAEALLESRCVPFLTEYFAKPAATSEATPPHQDQIFYRDHFGDELAITFWIALTDVTEDDGVLQYANPQPTVGELLKHRVSDVQNFGAELVDDSGFEFHSAPVPAGGAVVHHSYAVHRSGPMRGTSPRAAFALNFRRSPYRQQIDPWRAE
ncbi:phytanoyl-CoA dioxygenase family protein [Prauserella endophytica]|uniref:Phytanoyl-CoA dioxygenase family protein n=1 Tax=Prauserella endophytica TaxID=1592324 RepID=A0ABY2S1B9_9PSEU|nr:phytanoyl-CoA dioxygenase family protein [Prauserella endophytica]TKG66266.1 phytanoyl-CoA dioxygenase family protein [Prauserella endophytica]